MSKTLAIVLAAGKGTRMKSELPKVLVQVAGRPMIDYVLDTLTASGVDEIVVVVGYQADLVRKTLHGRAGVSFVEQAQQLGTGHAVMMCREPLARHRGGVLIVAGDSPLMQRDSIEELVQEFARQQPACLLGTAHKSEPHGLGRIVRDANQEFQAIVEEKDATAEQRKITEVNMSCYLFSAADLLFALDRIQANNAQSEYYLTDCPGVLRASQRKVIACPILKPIEALSINTPEELRAVEAVMLREQKPVEN
jgi:UDP-N-acetylglucosamine diphosphorylase/glucosamine-1-phosphate N-acetyltransferase